jgi:hypothetical protein
VLSLLCYFSKGAKIGLTVDEATGAASMLDPPAIATYLKNRSMRRLAGLHCAHTPYNSIIGCYDGMKSLCQVRRVQLITKLRKNMKNKLLPLFDKLLLRTRSIVETVNDHLKNSSQIEHSRHRSPFNFFVNLIAGLVAYTFREKKPSLNIRFPQALPSVAP